MECSMEGSDGLFDGGFDGTFDGMFDGGFDEMFDGGFDGMFRWKVPMECSTKYSTRPSSTAAESSDGMIVGGF